MTKNEALPATDPALARSLVVDELFDLTFYKELHRHSAGPTRKILEALIPVETRHLAFWKDLFNIPEAHLDFGRRLKLGVLVFACRLFGPSAIHLCLEAIEVYGIRKYLALWRAHRDDPMGRSIEEVLRDEFEHEDAIVTGIDAQRMLKPEDVRSIFLGLNDGLVEILGAVSGFFAAFNEPRMVLMAGSSVAVAGALSMAAGAFAASSSEEEMLVIERGKSEFLKKAAGEDEGPASPVRAAALVGVSYFIGALIPIFPVLLGARNLGASLLAAGSVLALVSLILAFLSGMAIRRRILTNLLLMALAVGVTYGIGIFARRVWGISV